MATYITKQLRGSGLIKLEKPYPNGNNINNYPQKDGGFRPHIWIKGSLNEAQRKFCDAYSIHYNQSFNGAEVYLQPKGTSKVVYGTIEMLKYMELLKPVISVLNSLR
jgi:hypothetical protein